MQALSTLAAKANGCLFNRVTAALPEKRDVILLTPLP